MTASAIRNLDTPKLPRSNVKSLGLLRMTGSMQLRRCNVPVYRTDGRRITRATTHGQGITEHLRAKPITPASGAAEREIMGLLINADAKFKNSWTNIMQYAFPDRKEAGSCSMKWYQLKKKDYFMIENIARRLTNEARIRLAKCLAKMRMKGFIDQGLPRKEPHPDTKIEKELRKRGKIDDNTSESERKR